MVRLFITYKLICSTLSPENNRSLFVISNFSFLPFITVSFVTDTQCMLKPCYLNYISFESTGFFFNEIAFLVLFVCLFVCVLLKMMFLCSAGYPESYPVDQASLELGDLLVSAS